jgi:hypothetical protein
MKHIRNTIVASAVAAALAVPLAAQAESNFTTGNTANITATARVNFSVVIPKFVFVQVGTGPVSPLLTPNATVDTVSFAVPAANVGDGSDVAGTGGNLTGGAVTVRVVGNNGNMTLGAVGSGTGLDSAGDIIPWSQILTNVTGSTAHPPIGGAAVTYTATSKIVNAAGTWTYAYDNSVTPPAGTFTGVVTYTATTP